MCAFRESMGNTYKFPIMVSMEGYERNLYDGSRATCVLSHDVYARYR